jgi:hypothetical protein
MRTTSQAVKEGSENRVEVPGWKPGLVENAICLDEEQAFQHTSHTVGVGGIVNLKEVGPRGTN